MSNDHTHQIYGQLNYTSHSHGMAGSYSQPLWTITEQKERPMTTLEKMRAERIEARERARITTMYAAYDEHLVEIERSIYTFNTQPGTDTERTYAALFVSGAWYVTGRESPNGLDTEDFVAWLIGKDVEVGDLVLVT